MPKNSRPNRDQIDEETSAYVDMVFANWAPEALVLEPYRTKHS